MLVGVLACCVASIHLSDESLQQPGYPSGMSGSGVCAGSASDECTSPYVERKALDGASFLETGEEISSGEHSCSFDP